MPIKEHVVLKFMRKPTMVIVEKETMVIMTGL